MTLSDIVQRFDLEVKAGEDVQEEIRYLFQVLGRN